MWTVSFIFRLTFLILVPLFQNDGHSTTGVEANPDAKRLYDDLLSHYNRLIRPVSNNSQVVTVGLGLHLTQLIDLVCFPFSFTKLWAFKCGPKWVVPMSFLLFIVNQHSRNGSGSFNSRCWTKRAVDEKENLKGSLQAFWV